MESKVNTNKTLGLVIFVVGLVLVYFGWQGSESIGGQLTEAVTGQYTDETMLYIVGGIVGIVVGGFMLARK
jgi:hypothetical protein